MRTVIEVRQGWMVLATLLLPALMLASVARAQEEADPVVREVHRTIAGTLNTVLEHSRSNHPVSWNDASDKLAGFITAYPPVMENQRPCRSFKYIVRDSAEEVTDSGLYCRDSAGLWSMAGVPDIVTTRAMATAAATPPPSLVDAGQADTLMTKLQRNLVRLAYESGPFDGLERPDFKTALKEFEADEELPRTTGPDAIRRALIASNAAVLRADEGGTCEALASEEGETLVCGRRR